MRSTNILFLQVATVRVDVLETLAGVDDRAQDHIAHDQRDAPRAQCLFRHGFKLRTVCPKHSPALIC